ncbi:ABC-F family ATP-binding cassette domain-containing protein [Duganella vulcania]|uniref:ATP-binding cassette domain-containing protein n=1 Tax=Duganella vulcania TaxID=2692166 RepID=A0A845H0I5_9BURK|nr:ATP-binding cassette domain-containing protein [Duganella vulcania]MYM98407.1 ATP-binding cassette domain-containing protein [Duganella vulcania]
MSMIQLQGLGLAFPHKICFSAFNATVEWGQRIAIVGDNGSGKSSLLKLIGGLLDPAEGSVRASPGLGIGYLAQVQHGDQQLSGGQRVNRALSAALASATDLLLLDEPTNHLDADNKRSLARMLKAFYGAVILVTHDEALMDQVCDTIWSIRSGTIEVFTGKYSDYLAERQRQHASLEKQLSAIALAKQNTHQALMQEQERASRARERGVKNIENRRWPTVKSPTKLGRGNTTAGRKQADIKEHKLQLLEQMEALRTDPVIVPRFHLDAAPSSRHTVLQISNGAAGYAQPVLQGIHLHLERGERLVLQGANGSGKSTLAQAIMGAAEVTRSGDWFTPPRDEIGYLDQHYANIDPDHTVLQALQSVVPTWDATALRGHLSDFLFRHNDLVHARVAVLSGGERARLSLACIAAKPPTLLILDEITNNLDMRMRQHVIEVVRAYPGALVLISHDENFLRQIGVHQTFQLAG